MDSVTRSPFITKYVVLIITMTILLNKFESVLGNANNHSIITIQERNITEKGMLQGVYLFVTIHYVGFQDIYIIISLSN